MDFCNQSGRRNAFTELQNKTWIWLSWNTNRLTNSISNGPCLDNSSFPSKEERENVKKINLKHIICCVFGQICHSNHAYCCQWTWSHRALDFDTVQLKDYCRWYWIDGKCFDFFLSSRLVHVYFKTNLISQRMLCIFLSKI